MLDRPKTAHTDASHRALFCVHQGLGLRYLVLTTGTSLDRVSVLTLRILWPICFSILHLQPHASA